MNRREMTRLLAVAGIGLAGGIGLDVFRTSGTRCALLITRDPDGDLERVRTALGLSGRGLRVEMWPVSPSSQDLTLVVDGRILDPVSATGVAPRIRALALALRSRRSAGTTLLSVADASPRAAGAVVLSRDGVVWDRLDLNRRYARIEMPVAQGLLVARLENRQLAIIEAPCRHRLCQRMGARSTGNLVCAPNHFLASIGGTELDAISA